MQTALVAAAFSVTLALGSAPAARADEAYSGRLHCDELPRIADHGKLNEAIEAIVSGTAVTFQRNVLVANTHRASGVSETGTGTVSGGQIVLTGGAAGAKYSYTSEYRGTIGDGRIAVVGEQIWNIRGWPYSPYHRACHAELSR